MSSQGGLAVDLCEEVEMVGREKREVEPWSSLLGTERNERVEKRRRQTATKVRMYMRALEDGLLKYMISDLNFRVVRYVPTLRHAGIYTPTRYSMTDCWMSSELGTWRLKPERRGQALHVRK